MTPIPHRRLRLARALAILLAAGTAILHAQSTLNRGEVHVWETQEIALQSAHEYANPYVDVACWIDLEGPGFAKRVHGFWDGGRTFRIRFVATAPGEWRWRAGSNQPDDAGLTGSGTLRAVAWTDEAKAANPNRHGFVRASANGHALQYADGTPFFLTGDTWLAASTWRLPFAGRPAAAGYEPGAGITFEDAVAWRKRQGFNSVSLIAAFPNWAADHRGATYRNTDGVYLRNAWEKFGHWAPNAAISTDDGATTTAKDMHDERGHRPFAMLQGRDDGLADLDRIEPGYFRSLDRKMQHLAAHGFVPFLEPVRRDVGPAWKAYFDFPTSYARFVQYLVARYGAYNLVVSGIHLDWIPKDYSLTEQEFNAALTGHRKTYGAPPFGQPVTALIDSSTYKRFGHGADCPWLTMHAVGNKPRNHAIYASIEELFRLEPAYPAANLEPYYAGWNHEINRPGGETPVAGTERDAYFARAQMYGSVLSGALAGHVHGTGAYDVTADTEAEGWRPYFWQAMRYPSGGQMQHLRAFVLSRGASYLDLRLANDAIEPRVAPGASDDGLDGWSFMMRTPDADLALLYLENGSTAARLRGFRRGAAYRWTWFDPRTGRWSQPVTLVTDAQGVLARPAVPAGAPAGAADWAARVVFAR
jgi:hypothetical protein